MQLALYRSKWASLLLGFAFQNVIHRCHRKVKNARKKANVVKHKEERCLKVSLPAAAGSALEYVRLPWLYDSSPRVKHSKLISALERAICFGQNGLLSGEMLARPAHVGVQHVANLHTGSCDLLSNVPCTSFDKAVFGIISQEMENGAYCDMSRRVLHS